jgi:putative hydrolase of the HAD superfamily
MLSGQDILLSSGYTSIIFDIGGVILEGNAARYCEQLSCNPDQKKELIAITKSEEWRLWDAGYKTSKDLIDRFSHLPIAEFISLFLNPDRPFIDETIEIIRVLKHKGYRLYILSNFSHESYKVFIERKRDLFSLFDGILCSSEVGKTKPETTIFHLFLGKFSIKASETLFIDDSIENIQAGELLGIKGICFVPGTLKKLLADEEIL